MPIPNSNRKISKITSIDIQNETFAVKLDFSTRFSYIKRSTVRDLNLSYEFSIILLKIRYKNKEEFLLFEVRDKLETEIILGNYAISILQINPET